MNSIWEKLLELANKGTSIVLTTHYIQEAQRAHQVGLMRDGRLLVDENPQTLMDRFECTNLEDVFCKAITQQERNPTQLNRPNVQV